MTPQFIAGERRVPDIVEPFQRFCGGALSPDEPPLAAGCISRGPAVQYLAIRRARAAAPDIDAILVCFSHNLSKCFPCQERSGYIEFCHEFPPAAETKGGLNP